MGLLIPGLRLVVAVIALIFVGRSNGLAKKANSTAGAANLISEKANAIAQYEFDRQTDDSVIDWILHWTGWLSLSRPGTLVSVWPRI